MEPYEGARHCVVKFFSREVRVGTLPRAKTLVSPLPGPTNRAAMSGGHLSKDFFELMCARTLALRCGSSGRTPRCASPHRVRTPAPRSKSIGECKSKQEEDKILAAEVATLRQRFTEQLSPKKMKEAVVRMM